MSKNLLLDQLNDSVKNKIIDKYGSLDAFYDLVYQLNSEEYKYDKDQTAEGNAIKREIETKLWDLENELEEFGVIDGHDILTNISSDFTKVVLTNHLNSQLPHPEVEILLVAGRATPPPNDIESQQIEIIVKLDMFTYKVTYEKGVVGNMPGWIPIRIQVVLPSDL